MTPTITIQALPSALADDLDGSFPALVAHLQDGIYSGCLRMTGDAAEAEDIAQEAFVRAYRALLEYDEDRVRSMQLRGWVWTIAANLCRNRARSRRRRPTDPLPPIDPPERGPGPEESSMSAKRRDLLAEHLARLPWAMRSAVVLRHVVGLGYSEIASALERPTGTVKADVHRGLARLRITLEGDRP